MCGFDVCIATDTNKCDARARAVVEATEGTPSINVA